MHVPTFLALSLTSVAWLTNAMVVTGFLNAVECITWVAVIGLALIDVSLATLARKSWWAAASVATHFIHTRSIVEAFGGTATRCHGTIILIYFT